MSAFASSRAACYRCIFLCMLAIYTLSHSQLCSAVSFHLPSWHDPALKLPRRLQQEQQPSGDITVLSTSESPGIEDAGGTTALGDAAAAAAAGVNYNNMLPPTAANQGSNAASDLSLPPAQDLAASVVAVATPVDVSTSPDAAIAATAAPGATTTATPAAAAVPNATAAPVVVVNGAADLTTTNTSSAEPLPNNSSSSSNSLPGNLSSSTNTSSLFNSSRNPLVGIRASQCPRESAPPAATNGITGTVVSNNTAFPFTAIGELYSSQGGRCTGALISPCHVLTAGHCLLSTPPFFGPPGQIVVEPDWIFTPGTIRGNSTPFGVYFSKAVSVSSLLANDDDSSYDISVISLTRSVRKEVGHFKIEAVPPDFIPTCGLHYAGYPLAGVVWYQHCWYAGSADGNNLFGTSCMGRPGVSGAPMWTFGPNCKGNYTSGGPSNAMHLGSDTNATGLTNSTDGVEAAAAAAEKALVAADGASGSSSSNSSNSSAPDPDAGNNIALSDAESSGGGESGSGDTDASSSSDSSSSSGGGSEQTGASGGCDERYLRAVLIGGVRGLSVAVSLQPDVVDKIERWMAAHPCSA